MNFSTSEQKLSAFTFKKLFNLGLHLNHKKKTAATKVGHSHRSGMKWNISNPVHVSIELTLVAKMLTNLLRAGGKIALINNGPEFRKGLAGAYTSIFEGVNITCYEDEWTPGTFTNPIHGHPVPDLVLFLSVDDKDRVKIISEITNLRLPVINLSSIKYNHALMEFEVGQNATKVFFFLQFFLYWIQESENRKMLFSLEAEDLLFVKKEEIKKLFAQWTKVAQTNPKKSCYFSGKKILLGKTVLSRKFLN